MCRVGVASAAAAGLAALCLLSSTIMVTPSAGASAGERSRSMLRRQTNKRSRHFGDGIFQIKSVEKERKLPKLFVDVSTGKFTDGTGRTVTLRGINSVIKHFPWYDHKMLDPARLDSIRDLGFNVVRLGAMWTGVEPQQGVRNMTYVNILKKIVKSLADRGVYTLLDLHQDVLWKAGRSYEEEEGNNKNGYWGVPPWVKHTLPASGPGYPWPIGPPAMWVCGYFTKEISSGFQQIYDDVLGTADSMAKHWRFMAEQFRNQEGVLGYELWNEPWAGDVFESAALLLPGVAGQQNLAPLYDDLHSAIRAADPDTLVFWEPVTWGYVLPFKANRLMDVVIKDFASEFTVLDLKGLLDKGCRKNKNETASESALARLKLISSGALKIMQQDYDGYARLVRETRLLSAAAKARLAESLTKARIFANSTLPSGPSVFGPGLSQVPGGHAYLNRTVMSWHYYCWLQGTSVDGTEPYDPLKRRLCDDTLGPMQFDTVRQRAGELGGSATMLTEFGNCRPSLAHPDGAGSIECDFVMREMEKRFESWTYWDTADGGVLWNSTTGLIDPDVAAYFARPFARALAGRPVRMSFDVRSRAFDLEFEPVPTASPDTEISVPLLQYPGGAYTVRATPGLEVRKAGGGSLLLVRYNKKGKTTTARIKIVPKKV